MTTIYGSTIGEMALLNGESYRQQAITDSETGPAGVHELVDEHG
jgi:hypothetical protein